jgi:hypothetical protein
LDLLNNSGIEKELIPGATIALGILYLGKPSEKLSTNVVNPQ